MDFLPFLETSSNPPTLHLMVEKRVYLIGSDAGRCDVMMLGLKNESVKNVLSY